MDADGFADGAGRRALIEVVGNLVFGADREVAEWVRQRINHMPSVEMMMPCTSIGVARHGRFVAGLVYNNFRWTDIQVTVAADDKRWCTRQVMREVHRYPFIQLGCLRVTCIVEEGNRPTLAFLEHWGFEREGVHPFLFRDGSAGVSLGLYRDKCRWLEDTNGQKHPRTA